MPLPRWALLTEKELARASGARRAGGALGPLGELQEEGGEDQEEAWGVQALTTQ